jgi:hypothetical protein
MRIEPHKEFRSLSLLMLVCLNLKLLFTLNGGQSVGVVMVCGRGHSILELQGQFSLRPSLPRTLLAYGKDLLSVLQRPSTKNVPDELSRWWKHDARLVPPELCSEAGSCVLGQVL